MRHDWVFDVLTDLRSYAQSNGLPRLSEQVELALRTAREEMDALAQHLALAQPAALSVSPALAQPLALAQPPALAEPAALAATGSAGDGSRS